MVSATAAFTFGEGKEELLEMMGEVGVDELKMVC
jgi:hypothetical protein